MRALALASLIIALAPGSVHAGPFCDQFQGATAEKQGAYVLIIVDEMLKNFPQHDRVKLMTTTWKGSPCSPTLARRSCPNARPGRTLPPASLWVKTSRSTRWVSSKTSRCSNVMRRRVAQHGR